MDMSDWLIPYVVMTPGAIDGTEEITCPTCEELLTVCVDDPDERQKYVCVTCEEPFTVDWSSLSGEAF